MTWWEILEKLASEGIDCQLQFETHPRDALCSGWTFSVAGSVLVARALSPEEAILPAIVKGFCAHALEALNERRAGF